MGNDVVKDALDYADALLDEGECADPFEAVAHEELVTQLLDMIVGRAGWRDAKIFTEHVFEGKTFKEIGADLRMSTANATRIYSKVFEKMRGYRALNMLFDHGFEEEVHSVCLDTPALDYFKLSDSVREYCEERTPGITESKLNYVYDIYGTCHPFGFVNKFGTRNCIYRWFTANRSVIPVTITANSVRLIHQTVEFNREIYRNIDYGFYMEFWAPEGRNVRLRITEDIQINSHDLTVSMCCRHYYTKVLVHTRLCDLLSALGIDDDILTSPCEKIKTAILQRLQVEAE